MKRSILSILVMLALVLTAPVIAQEAQEELPAENEALQETWDNRTQPDADSIVGDSALTITGTVQEWTDDQIALKTDTGVHHIKVLPNTDWDGELTVGEWVSIDYTRTTQGVMIAELVRSQGQVQTESTVTETTTSSLNTDADVESDMEMDTEAEMDMEADADMDLDTETEVTADFDADADLSDDDYQADLDTEDEWDSDDELPATGSELPLLGLLGLLSLVAAIGVRTFR
jgi:hypothetical protein